ncbi:MAG TPA: mannonate dehydratase [Thermomicrobiales bacterium]|nr:mannonate dehydratase [Thermomicrobiales bacterium]
MAMRMQLAEVLTNREHTLMWDLSRQLGVQQAVTGITDDPDEPPAWDFDRLRKIKEKFAAQGLDVTVIESAPASIQEPIKLGLGDRDEHIDHFCQLIENMGRLNIPIMCHNWMAGIGWLRTDFGVPERGGALVTGYDNDVNEARGMTEFGIVTEEQLWERMEYFLKRVVPVAEKAGVFLAVHPDDPPRSPVRGIGRILTSPENFQRVLDMYPSKHNGLTFCQGNFAAMGVDVPETIRHFGRQGAIKFVHFRDVRGNRDKFYETFHDNGQTDMVEAIRAYADVDFAGPARVDHVPTMAGEANDHPGYETMGRLYALGYMRGLMEAVAKEYPVPANEA